MLMRIAMQNSIKASSFAIQGDLPVTPFSFSFPPKVHTHQDVEIENS